MVEIIKKVVQYMCLGVFLAGRGSGVEVGYSKILIHLLNQFFKVFYGCPK